jgi:lysylphosphatidylglycerol synthetase-like protein (DUF2156 family)
MSTTLAESTACRNCGTSLQGRFCAICGQEDRPLDPSIGEVMGEAAREISALDGRILRSVRRLFLSPGFLTTEHLEGRRVPWVSPVRLYLIFSVCYFSIVSFTGTSPLDVNLRFTGDDEGTRQALQKLGFSSAEEMQHAINQALTTWIPRAMFLLVPLFAWLVSRVRPSGQKYPHHVIFACHVFAVFFGVQSAAVAAGYLSGSTAVASVLGAGSLLYGVIYVVLAFRSVYGGTIARALAHTAVVLAFYWLATIVVAAAIIVPVLFWAS